MSNMRRTTLGPVSSSGMNSRLSIGGAPMRFNKDDRRMSSIPGNNNNSRLSSYGGARESLGPNAAAGGQRTSAQGRLSRNSGVSAYGNRPGAKSDPRPLSDKAYMQACIRNLICFLTEHGFDQAISPKLLSTPTSKDFQHILVFLIRQIDPAFEFEKRFEDEVPALMKTLRYPFNVSKSALQAVGSPHTWPALLAALSWILELLQYDEAAREDKVNSKELDPQQDAFGKDLFFNYVTKTYDAFLAGDDDFEELEKELMDVFSQRDEEHLKRIGILGSENEELRMKIEELKTTESPLIELNRKKKEYEHDLDKFSKLIEKLEAHKMLLDDKLQEKKGDLVNKEAEREQVLREKAELHARIAEQESQAIDVSRIVNDRITLKNALQKVAEHRDEAERTHAAIESVVSKRVQSLDDLLRMYHNSAERLAIVPKTAKYAHNMQFRIVMTKDASACRPEDIISLDISKIVFPAIKSLKATFHDDVSRTKEELLNLQERINDFDERIVLKKDEVQVLEQRLNKLETMYKSEKDSLAAQLSDTSSESTQLEENVQAIRRETEESLRASQNLLDEEYHQYRKTTSSLQEAKQSMNDSLFETMDILTMHKGHIQETLSMVHGKTNECLAAIQQHHLQLQAQRPTVM